MRYDIKVQMMTKGRKLFILFLVGVCVMLGVAVLGKNIRTNTEQTIKESEKQEDTQTENKFNAKILLIEDEYIMVEALVDQNITGEVRINTGLLTKESLKSLQKGNLVCITHDGKMTMSIPPQMTAVEIYEITTDEFKK